MSMAHVTVRDSGELVLLLTSTQESQPCTLPRSSTVELAFVTGTQLSLSQCEGIRVFTWTLHCCEWENWFCPLLDEALERAGLTWPRQHDRAGSGEGGTGEPALWV